MSRRLGRPSPDPGLGTSIQLRRSHTPGLVDLARIGKALSSQRFAAKEPPSALLQIEPTRTLGNEQQIENLLGLDAEILIEAHLLHAQISFQLGDYQSASQQVKQVQEEANQGGFVWLGVQADRLFGTLLMKCYQHKEAQHYFYRAMQQSQQRCMRLEYAWTLQEWGCALLQWEAPQEGVQDDRWNLLKTARSILYECSAHLDITRIEQLLNTSGATIVDQIL